MNGHRRLEESGSTLDGPMFIDTLVAGIELIELGLESQIILTVH
jgi:hypothetical protein